MPDTVKINRDALSGLTKDERLIRYLEGLAQEIDDRAILTGDGSPSGAVAANLSRTYYDLATGEVWININATVGAKTGWLNKG